MFKPVDQEISKAVEFAFLKRGFRAKDSEIESLEICGNRFQIRVNQCTFRLEYENRSGYHNKYYFAVHRRQGGGSECVSEWTRDQTTALVDLIKAARNQRKRDEEIQAEINAAMMEV